MFWQQTCSDVFTARPVHVTIDQIQMTRHFSVNRVRYGSRSAGVGKDGCPKTYDGREQLVISIEFSLISLFSMTRELAHIHVKTPDCGRTPTWPLPDNMHDFSNWRKQANAVKRVYKIISSRPCIFSWQFYARWPLFSEPIEFSLTRESLWTRYRCPVNGTQLVRDCMA